MPASLMTATDRSALAALPPAELAAVAAAAAGREVQRATARAVPVDYDWGSPATAGLWRADVRAQADGAVLDLAFFVKLLRHPRLWPELSQIPDEAARQDFVGFFPWRFELDMHECGIGEILPAGMRTPVLYRARPVDADHVALWWEYVDQRPGPWELADYRRAARLLGALAARRRAGASANRRLPELSPPHAAGRGPALLRGREGPAGLPARPAGGQHVAPPGPRRGPARGGRSRPARRPRGRSARACPRSWTGSTGCRSATPTATRARRTCSSRPAARTSWSSSTGDSGPCSRWASTSGSCSSAWPRPARLHWPTCPGSTRSSSRAISAACATRGTTPTPTMSGPATWAGSRPGPRSACCRWSCSAASRRPRTCRRCSCAACSSPAESST